jgi:hypothetical protein
MTPPFGLRDEQLFEERADRPELFLDRSLKFFADWRNRSTRTSTFSGLPEQADDSFDGPDMVGESSLHRWGHSRV